MIYIILSDIHGNLEAFKAVIESFPDIDDREIICAGDMVGYGADPNECVDLISSLGAVNIAGNHDAAAIARTEIFSFIADARRAVLWTREQLTRASADYLRRLPLIRHEDFFTVVHGTLHKPEEFIYMKSSGNAGRTFEILKTRICFVGHSHVPGVFMMKNGRIVQLSERKVKIEGASSYIVNAGSVGQPRDGDRRACYCIYDTDKNEIEFRRIEYDIKTAHDKILKTKLPVTCAERLWFGK